MSFVEEVNRFERWVSASPSVATHGLSWDGVAVFEQPLPAGVEWIPTAVTYEPTAYEGRFAVVLATVKRDWVNLHAETVHEGVLIVALSWFAEPAGDERWTGERPRSISVNWSGFARGELEKLAGSAGTVGRR